MEKIATSPAYNKQNSNVISLEKGKIPPQAVDLEEVVLGAMMIDKKGVDEIIDILHPDAFYKNSHKLIYEAIFKLFENTEAIDLLTVSNQLKKDGNFEKAGGDYYLIQLTQRVSSSAHIEFHARIILQKYIQRSLIKISAEKATEFSKKSAPIGILGSPAVQMTALFESALAPLGRETLWPSKSDKLIEAIRIIKQGGSFGLARKILSDIEKLLY